MQVHCECLRELPALVELPPLEAEMRLLASARRVAAAAGGVEVHWVRDATLELSRVLRVTRWRARGEDEITVRTARRRFDGDAEVGDELLVPLVPFAALDDVRDELAVFERSSLSAALASTLTECVAGWLEADAGMIPRFSIDRSWRVSAMLSLEAPRLTEPTPYTLWNAAAARADFDDLAGDVVPDTAAAVVPRIDYMIGQIDNGGVSQLLYNGLRARVSLAGLAAALRRVGADVAAPLVDALEAALPPEAMATFLESDYFGDNIERDAIEAASSALADQVDAIQRCAVHWLWTRRERAEVADALEEAERPEIAEAVSTAVEHDDTREVARLRAAGVALSALGPATAKLLSAAAEQPATMRALLEAGIDPTGVEGPRGPILGAPACRELFTEFGFAPASPWTPRWRDVETVEAVDQVFADGIRPSAEALANEVWSHARDLEANLRLLQRAGEAGIALGDAPDGGAQALRNALERPELVQAILDAGVDPDARGRDGGAALHYADQPEVAERLVAAGADPNLPSSGPLRSYGEDGDRDNARFHPIGATPLDVAETMGRTDIAEVLRRHGARRGTQETWAVIVYARGSEDATLLERLGDTPEHRATIARIPRTSDAPVLHGQCVATASSLAEAETLARELARLGTDVTVV